jgi:hypothetical protein
MDVQLLPFLTSLAYRGQISRHGRLTSVEIAPAIELYTFYHKYSELILVTIIATTCPANESLSVYTNSYLSSVFLAWRITTENPYPQSNIKFLEGYIVAPP